MKIAAMYCDKEVTQGPDKGKLRRYSVRPEVSGSFPVYRRIPGASEATEKLEQLPSSLEEVFGYWSLGHPVRMYGEDSGGKMQNAVLKPHLDHLTVEYEKF